MSPARDHWGDALRDHFKSWGCALLKEMSERCGAKEGTISEWLKKPDCPSLHGSSIEGLTTALDVSPNELRLLYRVEPRGPHPVKRRGEPMPAPQVDWSEVRPRDIPTRMLVAALGQRGVSPNIIAEVQAQIRAAQAQSPQEGERRDTRTPTSSRRQSHAS